MHSKKVESMLEDENGTDSATTEVVDAQADTTPVDSGAETASQDTGDTQTDLSQLNTGAIDEPPQDAPPAQPPAPQQDYATLEKRFKDTQAWATQQAQRAKDLERQWDGLDPQRVRTILEQHEKAQKQQQASPFTRQHPEFSKNQDRVKNVDLFQKAISPLDRDADRDKINAIAANMGITREDLALHQQAQQYRESQIQELAADPAGFVTKLVEPLIQQQLQQMDSFLTGRANAQTWLNDPQNNEIVTKYGSKIDTLLHDDGIPLREKIATLGQTFARLEALEKQLGNQTEQVSQARAQQAALKTQATGVNRRSSSAPAVTDGAEYVRNVLKIKPTDSRWVTALTQVNSNIRTGQEPSDGLDHII